MTDKIFHIKALDILVFKRENGGNDFFRLALS